MVAYSSVTCLHNISKTFGGLFSYCSIAFNSSVRKRNEVNVGRPVLQDNTAGLRDDLVDLLEELLEGLK